MSELCSCIGAKYGEPLCYCKMVLNNLPLNESARKESAAQLSAALGDIFEWHLPKKDTE